jgi:TRAP-type mannitol/chloroaromatic compound transport system permease large subunit
MRSVAPASIPTREIFAAVTPYVVMGVLMIGLVWLVPGLATWLPAVLIGK